MFFEKNLSCSRSLQTQISNINLSSKLRYSIFLNGGVAKFILKEMMLVQPLSHIRLLATPGLQHTRLPMFRHLPEFAQTHIH